MSTHMEQDKPADDCLLDKTPQQTLGKPLTRSEGLAKVTGTAPYAAEYPVEGCLNGVLVTAPFARGTITSIDERSVTGMDGVLAVISDERLIARHIAFGKTPDAARAWVLGPDERNAAAIAATLERADYLLDTSANDSSAGSSTR